MNVTLAQKHHALNEACAKQLADILRTVDPTHDLRTYRTTAGGDARALRGIPALSRGVGSAIPGTQPLQALIAKERNSR